MVRGLGYSLGTTIAHTTILTMDGRDSVIRDGAVHVEDGRIVEIGPSDVVKSRNRTTEHYIDGKGRMILLPTLTNAHTHTIQTLLKGRGVGAELTTWLKTVVWPTTKLLKPSDMALAAKLSALEAIRSGCTLLLDHITVGLSLEALEAMAEAYSKLGVRAVLAVGMTQRTKRAELWKLPAERFPYSLEELSQMIKKAWSRLESFDKIRIWPAPITIFSSGPDGYRLALELAEEGGEEIGIHTHIAETKGEVESTLEDYSCREVEFLKRVGILGPKLSLAHGIWLEPQELELLSQAEASVVHCPASNMYLGSGVARVREMMEKGINVALGSDGGTCGATHDLLGVMRIALLLHSLQSPGSLMPYDVVRMATRGGARALLMKELGSIEVGKKADLLLIDPLRLYSSPWCDDYSNLALYANPQNVEAVMVEGELVVERGEVLRFGEEEEELLRRAQARAEELARGIS